MIFLISAAKTIASLSGMFLKFMPSKEILFNETSTVHIGKPLISKTVLSGPSPINETDLSKFNCSDKI